MKTTRPKPAVTKKKYVTAFQALVKIINESKNDELHLDYLVFSIDSLMKKCNYMERTTVQNYMRKLEMSGFVNRIEHEDYAFSKNCHIPDYIKSSQIQDYIVIKQDFDESEECKTGWTLAYQEPFNEKSGYSLETIVSNFTIVDHLELDKYANPTLVVFKKNF